jgi:parallel beta-helix repeat protein
MKRRYMAIGIILLFVGTSIIPAIAQNTEKSIPTSRGNWLYVGGNGPGNHTKIQDAINDASDGDTVFVYDDSSPYYENNISINTSINLIGEDRNTTIIDEKGGGYGTTILQIYADDVKVTGFTIADYNGVYSDTGIYIEGNVGKHNMIKTVSNVNISGNIFVNTATAIHETKTFHSIISGNIVYSTGFSEGSLINRGIDLSHALNSTIKGNTILYAGNTGICTEFSHCLIEGNFISYVAQPMNQYGISQMSSSNRIIGNTITKVTMGIVSVSSFSIISQNDISYCDYYGLMFAKPSRFNIITKNNISECEHYGIALYQSLFTVVKENNFIKNNNSAFFIGSLGTHWVHNYWDDWMGIGPKRIPGLFVFPWENWYYVEGRPYDNFDWRPAQEPYNIYGMT